jgi:vacuolar-type H+-ATPase subunit H
MAKKGTKNTRRTPEQMIADLRQKIEEVEQRAKAKELKQSGAMKRSLTIVRNIDKALEEAKEEGNTPLRRALSESRKPLESYLTEMGVKLPKGRGPRGRKPA